MPTGNLGFVDDLRVYYDGAHHDRHHSYHKQVSGYAKVILMSLLPFDVYHSWIVGACEVRIVGYGVFAPDSSPTIADVAEKAGNHWKVKVKFKSFGL